MPSAAVLSSGPTIARERSLHGVIQRGRAMLGRREDLGWLQVVAGDGPQDATRRNEQMPAQCDARHRNLEERVQPGGLRVVRNLSRAAEKDIGTKKKILQQRSCQPGSRKALRRDARRILQDLALSIILELE